MPLMTPAMHNALTAQVRTLYQRLVITNRFCPTDEEFLQLYVDPEHVPVLKETEKLVGFVGQTSLTSIYMFVASPSEQTTRAYLHVGFHKTPPIIIPNYAEHGFRDAPVELLNRVYDWAKMIWDFNQKFGDITDALYWVNDYCDSWDAARTILPILPVLMKNIDENPDSVTNKRAVRLQARPNVRGIPRLPREVKTRLIECSNMALASTLVASEHVQGNVHMRPRFDNATRPNLMYPDRDGTILN